MLPESDEALMALYQQGGAEALDTLVRRHANTLLGYLVRLTGDRHLAEDLFQETFVRVHMKAATFREGRVFKRWLFAIATHLSMDVFRRRRRQARAILPPLRDEAPERAAAVPDSAPDPAAQAARADTRREVARALETLPPRQRTTLVLAFFEGLSYPEVARTMGCSVGTVKTQVSRALTALARVLPEARREALEGGAS
jgi:RNA polymerase sigma-70 factor (ECF subfamily)